MTDGYRLGAHSLVRVARDHVAMVSRDTRGWALLSAAEHAQLRKAVSRRPAPREPWVLEALEKLHSLGLATKDGAYPPRATPTACERPESLLLKMTGRCNYRCRYCYDFSTERSRRTLDPALAIRTIDTLVAGRKKLTVTFHGGEPLLCLEAVREIVRHCEQLRRGGTAIRYAMQTNGALLDDHAVAFLEEHRFSVGISLDGVEPATDAMRIDKAGRRTPSSVFMRLLERYGEFVRRRCGVLAVIYQSNIRQLPDFARWLQDNGIGGLSTTVLDPAGRASGMDGEEVTPQALVGLYRTWMRMVATGSISTLALTNLLAYVDNLCTFDPPSFCQKGPCGAAGDFLVLDADGTFRACDCVIHDFFVLGGPATPVEEVLGPVPRRPVVERHLRLVRSEPCARCPWIRLCGGTCAAKALGRGTATGEVYAPECALVRYLYPAILKVYASDPSARLFDYHRAHSKLSRVADASER